MRNLTLRGLRVFEAAATTGSFSRAGELMGMTQSAVSQQIRQLEEEIGTRLFDTAARPIRLTEAGAELLRHTRVVLAQLSVAEDALSTLQGSFRGQLHVGVVSPGQYFVPRLLTSFRRLHPALRLKLSQGRRDQLLERLSERQIDLLIGGYPPAEAEVEIEVFARHPHCIVASAEHPLVGAKDIEWGALADETFILRETGSATRAFLEHLLQVQRLQVRTDVEMQGPVAVNAAVMAGMGISFVSAHTVQSELASGRIAVLDVQEMPKLLDWCVLTRRDTPLSFGQRLLRDHILAEGEAAAACRMDQGPIGGWAQAAAAPGADQPPSTPRGVSGGRPDRGASTTV
ncbi:LysR family transcriptional regulator [Pseudorhodoferax sp.]|jgi:DNA-binding transcriptional LysR family regulator|uniref:LysR family transcriptional regulator n=1 Tax=Pseudorhodoferax sp. TaxID=1993553 RepID=UPI002DD630FE|nr:LysR family transcriptional regulator [Pseudorhodoferax sp.]